MRVVRWPLPADTPRYPQWSGPAVIFGHNAIARALQRQIETSGGRAHLLPTGGPLEETLTALDAIWNETPAPHLFLVSGSDGEVLDPHDQTAWQRRREAAIEAPFFVCQRWVQRAREADILNRSTIVATTSLGGDFGFSGNIPAIEGGWLTGLMKSLFIEIVRMGKQSDLLVKAIDAPPAEPPELLAGSICRELAARHDDFEVAYVGGRRYVQNAYPCDVDPVATSGIREGSVWVVTGGARGITAACALELGRRYGLKLHLIGASPRPEIDPAWLDMDEAELAQLRSSVMRSAFQRKESPPAAWSRVERSIEIARSLRTFDQAGIEATYHGCDVGNRAAVAGVLDAVRRQDGPIEGILHGAGIDIPRRIEKKERSGVMATFAAKVQGAANLIALTQDDPLRHFIGFGSVSGRLGSNGQTDYAAASDMLCKITAWFGRARPECHVVGFHWAPWDEVGMAARPENRVALKVKDAPQLMPKDEGVRHFLRELYDRNRPGEVLVIDPTYYKLFYNKGEPPAVADEQAPDIALPAVAPQAAPAETAEPALTDRFVLRMFESPAPQELAPLPDVQGTIYILGDNPIAAALEQQLHERGQEAVCLRMAESSHETIKALEAAWQRQPGNYLLLTTACDVEAPHIFEPLQWHSRLEHGVRGPYLVCQRWWQLWQAWPERTKATVAAVTRMGGDYGLGGNCVAPEGGALAGMLKSLFIEDFRRDANELRVRVIDTRHDEEPANVARWTIRELTTDSSDIEVGWLAGRRFVLRPVQEGVPPAHCPIEPGGVWVISGGACGISAATALELGRRYGLKLHLLGRSPAPAAEAPWRGKSEAELETLKAGLVRDATAKGESPTRAWERIRRDMEIWNNLQKFAAAGVAATYHPCDVSDRQALVAVLDRIRRQDGPIAGVLHGAGTNNPSRFERKPRHVVEEMIAAKVTGAWNLMVLTRQDPVRYFVGFGSVTGRFGGNGMTDYAAVNDMLAKLIAWYRRERPDCRAACFDWESWGEVGMAVAPRHVMAGVQGKLEFMRPAEGVEHLVRELQAGGPEAEVLFTRERFIAERYPHVQPAKVAEISPLDWPLIERVERSGDVAVATATLDPVVDPFLREHRLRDKALMPAVVGMELLAEAAAAAAPDHSVVALRDVQIIDGLAFRSDGPQSPRVTVEPRSSAERLTRLTCDFHNRSGKLIQANRPYLNGIVELGSYQQRLMEHCPQPPDKWRAFQYEDDHLIYHGPCLRGVTATTFTDREGWAKLVALPLQGLAGRRPAGKWIIPSTLLDAAFYACGIHVWFHGGQAISLPHGIRELQLGRSMHSHERCLVRFVCRRLDGESAEYDFTIYGEDGEAIVAVSGYRKVLLRQRGGE
jgi:NAD(P)-dependent dehydrogenase (short-subunit alcohol dehydrogenase family)